MVDYEWKPSRAYRLRVWKLEQDSGGQWWSGWVQDTVTGIDTHIGAIRVPLSAGQLANWSTNWSEYFPANATPLSSCSAQPYSRVRWREPRANGGTVKPLRTENRLSDQAGCQNGAIFVDGKGILTSSTTAAHARSFEGTCSGANHMWQLRPSSASVFKPPVLPFTMSMSRRPFSAQNVI